MYSMLISSTSILQSKEHHLVTIYSLWSLKAIISSFERAFHICLYSDDPSIKDNVSCLVVVSTLIFVMGNWTSSLGHALFRSQKSTQTWSCPFFFLRGTMFSIHIGYMTSWMNPASINLLTSTSIWGISSSRKHLWACLIGRYHGLTGRWWHGLLPLDQVPISSRMTKQKCL